MNGDVKQVVGVFHHPGGVIELLIVLIHRTNGTAVSSIEYEVLIFEMFNSLFTMFGQSI